MDQSKGGTPQSKSPQSKESSLSLIYDCGAKDHN